VVLAVVFLWCRRGIWCGKGGQETGIKWVMDGLLGLLLLRQKQVPFGDDKLERQGQLQLQRQLRRQGQRRRDGAAGVRLYGPKWDDWAGTTRAMGRDGQQ
jgi:hypothetical protein